MKKFKELTKKMLPYFIAFILPILLFGFCLFLRIKNEYGDLTIFYGDMSGQYAPLFSYLKNVFAGTESIFYSFSKGIGGNMVGTIAYYLTSPLNLLFLFGSKASIPIITVIILLLKVGLAGLFMYIFLLHMLKKKDLSLIIFSTCYALSAYMVSYYFCIMWLDCVFLLPLIMLGIHRICHDKSPILYIVSLTIAIVSNYYIGYMLCIFSCIYFVYEIIMGKNDKKSVFKYSKKFIISSLLSGLMTLFILVPMFVDLMTTARAIGDYKGNYNLQTVINNLDYLQLFKNLLMGTRNEASIPLADNNYYNIYIYCGIIILPLIYFYFISKNISKKEKRFSGFIILLFLASYSIKYVNYVWHGFAFPNGLNYRFAFIFIFYFVYMAAKSFYNIKGIDKKYYYYFLIGFLLLLNITAIFNSTVDLVMIYINLILMILYLILLYLYNMDKIDDVNKRDLRVILPLLIFGELLFNCYFSLDGYFKSKLEEYNDNIEIYQSYIDKYNVSSDKDFYRMNIDNLYNINPGLFYNYNGFNTFLSTNNQSTLAYFKNLGYGTGSLTHFHDTSNSYISDNILGLKYYLSLNECIHAKEVDSFEFSKYNGELYNFSVAKVRVCENEHSLPLGYLINSNADDYEMNLTDYFTYLNMNEYLINSMLNENKEYFNRYKDVKRIDEGKYQLTLDDSDYLYVTIGTDYEYAYVTINDESITLNADTGSVALFKNKYKNEEITVDIRLVKGGFIVSADIVNFFSEKTEDIENSLDKIKENSLQLEKMSDTYIKGTVNVTNEDMGMLFLSIPYEEGWIAYVDGKETEIKKMYDAFMGISLPDGEHTIELRYKTPGLKLGVCISVITFVITVIYLSIEQKKRKESQIMLEK